MINKIKTLKKLTAQLVFEVIFFICRVHVPVASGSPDGRRCFSLWRPLKTGFISCDSQLKYCRLICFD